MQPLEHKAATGRVLVPPRRGQRVKSVIMAPFCNGKPFLPVLHTSSDGAEVYGVVHEAGSQETSVWLQYDIMPTRCANDTLMHVQIPKVPPQAYTEVQAVIGGIGKHLRWQVVFPPRCKGTAALSVGNIQDLAKFREFMQNVVRPFGLCTFEVDAGTTLVTVPDSSNLGTVAAVLHCAGYTATPSRAEFASNAKLAIERYDRCEHLWWDQDQQEAGPLRDMHRWKFDYIPASWTTLPFTWQALCHNIKIDPLKESACLPRPLRDFYLTHHMKMPNVEPATAAALEQLRGAPSVTSRLSTLQNVQLLTAAYWTTIAPFNAVVVEACSFVRFRYMLHGYLSREIGGYSQTAQHLGHGAHIREFRNKPQYDFANLDDKTLNAICKKNGQVGGTGFKGTRGKYGHADFPKYIPQKRMRRNDEHEETMRNLQPNIFDDYRSGAEAAESPQSLESDRLADAGTGIKCSGPASSSEALVDVSVATVIRGL